MNNNELKHLVQAGVITEETAERIRMYYGNRTGTAGQTLFTVFATFASLLVGLGIILIVAHNWDQLTKSIKIVLSILPLAVAQGLCLYTLLKRPVSMAWREGCSTFMFFSFGACIALVSQIYHLPGDLGEFLFTWMLLCLPVLYLMNSSVVSVLYLAGITWYAAESNYWSASGQPDLWYWLMLLLAMPHYYFILTKRPESNFSTYHNWIIPLSLTASLGTLTVQLPEFMYIAYMSLFGVFYQIGHSVYLNSTKRRTNGYLIVGSLGSVSLLLFLSFEEFWNKLSRADFQSGALLTSPELVASLVLIVLAALLLYQTKRLQTRMLKPLDLVPTTFVMIFLIGTEYSIAVVLVNVLVLLIGVITIREGVRSDHLGLLNYGLLIISALTACRFFDTDLSFVIRGILFITVGIVIFILNTWMLRRRT